MTADSDGPAVVVVDPDGRLTRIATAIRQGGVRNVRVVDELEAVKAGPVDCVLVPDGPATGDQDPVDGVEIMAAVRGQVPETPVGVYTFRSGREAVVDLLETDADTVVRVPPDRATVLASRVRQLAESDSRRPPHERFESLLDHYPEVVYLKDCESRFVDSTRFTFEEYEASRLDREQVVGLTDYELYDRELADALFEEEQELLAREESIVEKIEHYVEDGEDRWVSTTKVPRYDADGDLLGLIGDVRDVTRIKRQERMMATLHEASRGLVRADTRGEVGEVAVAIATEIDPLPRARVDLRTDSGDLEPAAITDDTFTWDPTTFRRAADSGTAQYRTPTGEFVAVGRDDHRHESLELPDEIDAVSGLRIPLGEHGVLGLDADDSVLEPFTIELAHVLAANVEAALDRAEQQRQLAAQAERLEEFALLGSHELRNRLQIALGTAERARAQGDVEAVGDVIETLGRMDRLVTQLLTLARTGAVSQTSEAVALSGVATVAWEAVDGDAGLSVDADGILTANRDGLLEIFEMLFRVAVDGNNSDTVSVGTTADGFYVDEGVTIGSADETTVLEPTYSEVGGSTGDSVYLVSVIADAHDWEVAVTDGPDDTTRFVFSNVDVKRVE